MERECKKHGLTKHSLESDGKRWRCRRCRVEAVTRRRRKLKRMAVEYKGGSCIVCGYNKCIGALEFHHRDETKEFGIAASGHTQSWEKVKNEIEKCDLVCANCHREIHGTVF